jgi:hypothetical protein
MGVKKTNGCAVYVESKGGKFYIVALSENEEGMVLDLISQMHGGTIKACKEEQPLKRNKVNK